MTQNQAKALVEAELRRIAGAHELVILDNATIERNFGWVFFYQSRSYLETGQISAALAGNAPYIVDRQSGALHVTGTARPIEEYIAQYENRFEAGV